MKETERIAEQLRLLFEGPSWLGPPIELLLSGISQERAAARPLAGAHTIWELVLHIATWLRIARLRLTATAPVDPMEAENWPPAAGSWEDAIASIAREMKALRTAVLEFPPERLEERAPAAEAQTFYVLLHGVIQHSAYHAGQIAILKAGLMPDNERLLTHTYERFNARDIESVLATVHEDVVWANGLEGGYVHGRDGVRDYWTRLWAMMHPRVEPVEFSTGAEGEIIIEVHQVVLDLHGALLLDRMIGHIFRIENGLIKRFDVRDS